MGMRLLRTLALAAIGFGVTFVGFLAYITLVAAPLQHVGIPSASWFGSDYTDPRGAVLSGGMALFVIGLLSFSAALWLNRQFHFASYVDALLLCNPVSAGFGLLVARFLVRNMIAPEFFASANLLLPFGWIAWWHLAVIGLHGARTKSAIGIAAGYMVLFVTAGLLAVRGRYSV
jgi:hypothetical protein